MAYLLIIDAASRYVFAFPLKSKHPPINIIDKFLDKYGTAKQKIITTSPNGTLKQSHTFAETCRNKGYTIADNTHPLTADDDIAPSMDQIYTMENTAPAASAQNAIVERPHQTLKTKVQCLLYSA